MNMQSCILIADSADLWRSPTCQRQCRNELRVHTYVRICEYHALGISSPLNVQSITNESVYPPSSEAAAALLQIVGGWVSLYVAIITFFFVTLFFFFFIYMI